MAILQCVALPQGIPCQAPPHCVVSLGNFDGVHLAHQELLQAAKVLRDQSFPSAVCAVFCFWQPSSDFLSPAPAAHLCSLEQKLQLLWEAGVEYAFLTDFPSVRELSPEEFVKEILTEQCHAVAAVCGFNHRFGKNGKGTADRLSVLLNAPVHIQPPVTRDGETVSSTHIRKLLLSGRTEDATQLLGRPYTVTAPVTHGKELGRKLGFPTVNQSFPKDALIPRHGVYLTACQVDDRTVFGISNVGVHPTVDLDAAVNCETFLLDFEGDLYEKTLTVSFLRHLRDEQKFPSKKALIEQIEQDIALARQIAAKHVL